MAFTTLIFIKLITQQH